MMDRIKELFNLELDIRSLNTITDDCEILMCDMNSTYKVCSILKGSFYYNTKTDEYIRTLLYHINIAIRNKNRVILLLHSINHDMFYAAIEVKENINKKHRLKINILFICPIKLSLIIDGSGIEIIKKNNNFI